MLRIPLHGKSLKQPPVLQDLWALQPSMCKPTWVDKEKSSTLLRSLFITDSRPWSTWQGNKVVKKRCLEMCKICSDHSMKNWIRAKWNFHLQWNPSGKARNVSLKLQNLVHFHAPIFTNNVYFTPRYRPPLLKGHHLEWPLLRGSTVSRIMSELLFMKLSPTHIHV